MTLSSNWKIYFKSSALKNLRSLPRNFQERIAAKMRFFVSSGNPLRFTKNLKDKTLGGYRFRVGGYRIVVDIIAEKKEIIVLKIGKRDEVYK